MIVIAGGSGTLGRVLAARLATAGCDVRVLARHPAEGLGAEVRVADVRDPSSLSPALAGATVVISAVHGFLGGRGEGPEEIDLRGNTNLMRAAADAGVEHFLLVSVLDARADHPMSLHRNKYAAEQHLHAGGLQWTVLRPSAYVETWADVVGGRIPTGGPALVLGRGENPINFVSVQDVATVVVRAVADPALRGQTIDLPGADNLTLTQLARHLGATRIRHVPRGALRAMAMVMRPISPARARQATAALVMDTTDMTADASALRDRFPDITWHPASAVADELGASFGHSGVT